MVPLLPVLFAAATAATPTLRAERTAKAPVLDGRVDEVVWNKAVGSSAFTQKFPVDGVAPSEPTTVRVLYDDTAIYIAIECVQKTSAIVAPLTRRDREIESDRVSVSLATRGDGTTAFEFIITPAGVIADATRFDDTDSSRDWDENWIGKASKTADGWSAELQIPLRTLRFEERPSQSFGFQVRRYTSARKESDEWAHIPRSESGEVSRYGRLDNLIGLKKGPSFAIRPFVVGRIGQRDTAVAPLSSGFSPSFSAGADFKWLVLPSLTLDGAINPDFGQVDADKVVLNLSNYEVYFPEKRPFFLEAADVFSTPLQLVYTRRVGRAAFVPAVPADEQFRTTPDPSPIYGALKLTGTVDEKWNLGALLALSGGSSAEDVDGAGKKHDRIADPLAVFKVLRLRRVFESGASIGVLATGVSRLESPGDYPEVAGEGGKPHMLCPGGEELPRGQRCFHNAYALAMDGRYRFGERNYVLTGQVAGTLVEGGPPRQQLDGTVIRSGDVSPAGKLELKKDGGGRLRGAVGYQIYGQNVDYNDLGYMQRQNAQIADGYVEYGSNGPFSRFNDGFAGVYAFDNETLELLNTGRGGGIFGGLQFTNFWRAFFEVAGRADYWDDREIGDGAALERPGAGGLELGVSTDERKLVTLSLYAVPRLHTTGAVTVWVDATLKVRALPQLELELSPNVTYTNGEARYYGETDDVYLFGQLEAASLSATLSATYTFLPTLTLQVYGQGFMAYGRYTNFTSFSRTARARPRIALSDLVPGERPAGEEPDFASGAFNANVVIRWEYRLGSTVYVVYTHAQSDARTPLFNDAGKFDFRLSAPRPAADVLLLKASYWWG